MKQNLSMSSAFGSACPCDLVFGLMKNTWWDICKSQQQKLSLLLEDYSSNDSVPLTPDSKITEYY